MSARGKLILAGGLFAFFAVTHGDPSLISHATLDSAAAVPAGGSYTPYSWATTFLAAIPEPVTGCNIGFVTAWEAAEGGNWNNAARYNPINTTEREPGSWSMNSVGVQAYPSWQEGMQATVTTIRNGNYQGILDALAAGDSAQAAANAVGASPWGTGYFTAHCD
jgi:hypothetical protein